ncbi:ribonuclease P [Streptococcus loxodontisalivarius]|uniref:Uncharacterized protein n=1 Tax=Streptococcus loxodontisalivarius TaxID=1349415 RepID=A0ABS2PU27_9STRE|nr:ribonuclease P [Streptococcus loxodontisalivarius]MBM7643433.1 hypothetical protein [Streptococcus loxodontisalivarius]
MFSAINDYLACQGFKYIKPEKAGPEKETMEDLKSLGQAARKEMQELSKEVNQAFAGFEMTRVSNWANQAQIARPHFWCYFMEEGSHPDEVGIAIRLYGEKDHFGISVEVSFVERKKSAETLAKQSKILDLPIAEPLYYFVQVDGLSHRQEGSEDNRLRLQKALADGEVRKVLLKYDIPVQADTDRKLLVEEILAGIELVMPYYEATK